jgi:hypothetical protein
MRAPRPDRMRRQDQRNFRFANDRNPFAIGPAWPSAHWATTAAKSKGAKRARKIGARWKLQQNAPVWALAGPRNYQKIMVTEHPSQKLGGVVASY